MPKSTLTEKRYSVCVGINHYSSSLLPSLKYAENDARAMDNLLGKLGFSPENRLLLTGENATLDTVNAALSDIILDRPHENDLVVFYFAGHSKPLTLSNQETDTAEPRSEVFLTTYDFDPKRIKCSRSFRKQRALGMERIRKDFFEGEGARKRLFIFDSCYSGDFYGLRYRDDNDPVQSYVKRMLDSTSIGRVALSSCLPIQKATEDPILGHGRFTYYLLKALAGNAPEALRQDGWLTVSSLFEYVAEQLPEDQRPVLSGVQQDTFQLVCYQERVAPKLHSKALSQEDSMEEREGRLRALLADHSSFIRDRLSSFVGRAHELAEIQRRITEKQQTGGYVTITGQAGQGKSSVIAKLVEEYEKKYGTENIAFHFIPFNPGPDHQVGLMRNIMARLILKYNLSDLYVASESRSALRDYFVKVLMELAAKHHQEVIFIDGLDQLEEDLNGVRDLSFLSNNPPEGVVFVLGTRPNDTLRPLELLKPYYEYSLPNLSRQDFNLILQHREVQLDKFIADQFYQAMQENALYLDLVAKELRERGSLPPGEVITQIAHNPANLFSISMSRLKRRSNEWREVIKPVLGILLVAREPLGMRHIRQIIGIEDDRLREGIDRLGGLITKDWQQRYSLFHLKLYDYLRQKEQSFNQEYVFATDEEEEWHKKLALWCEKNHLSTIWHDDDYNMIEQKRREYARKHYITHLYYAKDWQKLFEVLDSAQYGQAKVRDDPSTRSYTQDVDLGQQAAAWEGWTIEEGIDLLPRLWQYTLLRCSLTSRADQYPEPAFKLLILLRRKREALGLAELLTKPAYKMRVLLVIAMQIREQADPEVEWLEILTRAGEVAQMIDDSNSKAKALCELSIILTNTKQWEQAKKTLIDAEAVILTIENSDIRTRSLCELGVLLIQAHQWNLAERLIRTIERGDARDKVLCELGSALAHSQQWEQAEEVLRMLRGGDARDRALCELGSSLAHSQQWERAEKVIYTIEGSDVRANTQCQLGIALVNAKQWIRAEEVIHTIKWGDARVKALCELGVALSQAHLETRATRVWNEAEAIIHGIAWSVIQVKALFELGVFLTHAQQGDRAEKIWKEAEALTYSIGSRDVETSKMLFEMAMMFLQAQQWKIAERLINAIKWRDARRVDALYAMCIALIQAREWERAEQLIFAIEENNVRIEMLCKLSINLVQAQQWEYAERIWKKAERIIRTVEWGKVKDLALFELATALSQSHQWEDAKTVIHTIKEDITRAFALSKLTMLLAYAHEWKQAEETGTEIEKIIDSIEKRTAPDKTIREVGVLLARSHQWKRAEHVIRAIDDNDIRIQGLHELSRLLVLAKRWDHAERVISTAGSPSAVAISLSKLGVQLMHVKQQEYAERAWAKAEEAILTITSYQRNEIDEAYSELGMALIQTQQWQWAEKTIIKINAKDIKTKTLHELLMNLIQAQQWEQVEKLLLKVDNSAELVKFLHTFGIALANTRQWGYAETVLRKIEDHNALTEALCELSLLMAQTQQQEQAKKIWTEVEKEIYKLEDDDVRTDALHKLATVLAHAEQWQQVEQVIDTIENNYMRDQAICEWGIALAHAQQWIYAESVLHRIENNNVRADALCKLSLLLAQAQQWERVELLVNLIGGDSDQQSKALHTLVMALIQMKQWKHAEQVACKIENNYARIRTLRALGIALAHEREWKYAERVISMIRDIDVKYKVLRELASRMGMACESKLLLNLVQSSWGHAGNKEDALKLFSLATELIPSKLEIGLAFCEAFAWVDDFLKG